MSAAEEMRDVFVDAGLVAPPVPSDLEPDVRRYDKWLYATRRVHGLAMYRFGPYVGQAMSGPVDDYMAAGCAGHGANSYCINYHLVWGPIAVFAQTLWGGVYTDREQASARVRAQFGRCGELIEAAAAVRPELERDGRRLHVAESDIRESTCGWVDPAARTYTRVASRKWSDPAPPVLVEATALLRSV